MELKELDAPYSYKNWKEFESRKPSLRIEEYPLFSDAHLTDTFTEDCGPYQFLHLVGQLAECGVARPKFILRFSRHIEVDITAEDMKKKRDGIYHGGNPVDEIAALASLAMGVRLKAGGPTREFRLGEEGDPLGTPMGLGFARDPVIPMGNSNMILPNSCGPYMHRNISKTLKPFATLPRISNSDAAALVRAARLYQDALWIVESEPSLAWLMLVSAMETAASHWRNSSSDPYSIVKELDPDLYKIAKGAGDTDSADKVIRKAAKTLKSTKKFLDFSMKFRPPPPERPEHEWAQHSWRCKNFRATVRKIYDHRSTALHDGRPFPAPMCQPPTIYSRNDLPEVPLGSGSSSGFSTWPIEDTPILLHTYEYIVRGSLLKWWDSMVSAA
ncbi:MAG: hypothetical protein OXI80_15180 [Caldilineaceae bacterium]|nr:hypothetical protein [Caldilineaceae bacterium]MDE0338820.1 hypothetical protein [Caldilineaceae bacterium]MDE0339012.1 hypothetical protein [Caldilineaceae bacterium]